VNPAPAPFSPQSAESRGSAAVATKYVGTEGGAQSSHKPGPNNLVRTDNNGKVTAELNTSFTPDGKAIVTNTLYYGERIVSQHVSVRNNQGNVTTTDVLGGKILP
jgi:hypothetical protein